METIDAHHRLSRMTVFAYVVEQGSFSAAASLLGLSKSAVSKQIKALETSVGVSLLSRSTRRVSLTAAGEVFYQSCARVVGEAAAAELSIGEMQQTPTGRLRLNAPVELGGSQVAAVVAEFILRYPAVKIEMTLQDELVDIIGEGVDIAIRIGRLEDSSLVARRIGPIATQFAASPSYLARRGQPHHHHELRDHDFLLYSLLPNPRKLLLRKNGKRYVVSVDGPLSCNSGRARREAALRGLGIVHLPNFYISEDISTGKLVALLTDYELPQIAMHAVFPPGARRTPASRLLIDFLVEELGKNTCCS